jgi:hypothetical protein
MLGCNDANLGESACDPFLLVLSPLHLVYLEPNSTCGATGRHWGARGLASIPGEGASLGSWVKPGWDSNTPNACAPTQVILGLHKKT